MKKFNRLMLLGGAFGLALAAADPVLADAGPWSGTDANKDGIIDQSEFSAGRASHFKTLDADADGFVSEAEMKAFHDQMQAKMAEKRADMPAKFLAKYDADKNGKISAAEWPKEARLTLENADANSDGAVTAEELGTLHKAHDGKKGDGKKDRFARLDGDKDGKVSLAEWNAASDKLFARLDDNKDGKVTGDEMPKHHKHHQGGDAPVLP